uniref:Bm13116, isoform b n=1 Tax=Brugia malayi TaxID=6279 RepID=A0A1I9G2T3_BRUMA|nr:Bm13116, isoform b [Brugia malayi]
MLKSIIGRHVGSLHLTEYKFEIDSFAQYYGSLSMERFYCYGWSRSHFRRCQRSRQIVN